uniref:GATOR2 complex protein MIOS isoform X2 n=1 Tax=Myxine glutinosa TaxID=7769 RepID=UPI00358F6695
MSGLKPDILWSPQHDNKFVICDSEIALYRMDPVAAPAAKTSCHRLSEETAATLLAINSETPYMKCIAWCPRHDAECLLAVGQANGRVVLTSLGQESHAQVKDLACKEFIPKHARQCNTLAWNPKDTNLLAAGLDKHRADFSVLVWDVNSKYGVEAAAATSMPQFSATDRGRILLTPEGDLGQIVMKPLAEFGQNDACLSIAWIPHNSRLLLAGMHRNLVTYDLRDTSQKQLFANSKAVQGVAFDPHFSNRFASFVEGQVAIWDYRMSEKPVLTLNEPPRQLSKVAWCPERPGLLATLARDSGVVRLYDMQHTQSPQGDDTEPPIIERSAQPFGSSAVAAFTWIPTSQTRMLALSQARVLCDFTVFERIAFAWGPSPALLWACGRHLYECEEKSGVVGKVSTREQDVAGKMKRRALAGYGLETEIVWKNFQLAGDQDPQLKSLWYTLHFMKHYTEDMESQACTLGSQLPPVYHGVKRLVKSESGKSEICVGAEHSVEVVTFKSEARSLALQLCGWRPCGNDGDVDTFLLSLERFNEWERAAAISLFNLKIRLAIQILQKGAASGKGDLNLNVVAMALSGYTDDRASLWREMCGSLRLQLSNPYLRAVFTFLTSEVGSYDDILNESNMAVRDRVAFACMFLKDSQLFRYLDKLTNEMKESGNLEGILLTGLTQDGIDLMASYVDRTSDVQTASLCMLQATSSEVIEEARVQHWVESYRDLLDAWRLWHKRAAFDIHRSKLDPAARPLQQVFVSCNFCGKSISSGGSATGHQGRSFTQYNVGGSPIKSKVTSCPGCRKPLPRCALCLINMGTAASPNVGMAGKGEEEDRLSQVQKLSQFNSWFTWCQSCRHGGHAGHMMSWFREHTECPVSACSCKCMQLDATGSLTSAQLD